MNTEQSGIEALSAGAPAQGSGGAQKSNHDPKEIARFDEIAQRWWDPKGDFRPLHVLNPVRLDYIDRRAGGLRGKRVLDVGCGGGLLSEAMAQRGAQVTGIDLGKATIEVAELHALDSGVSVRYLREAAEDHAAHSPAAYDVVTCMEMLEHVPQPQSVMRALRTLVKPDGHVVVSTLNRNLKSYLLAIVGAEYVLGLLARGTHTYEQFIRPSELSRWARAAEFAVLDIAGLEYHPLTESARATGNVEVNYMMHLRPERNDGR
jgi:2-polyprenyl-6-hydroxyphenyl methylase/3-demethylubiquinone-9 3-methyltransferase